MKIWEGKGRYPHLSTGQWTWRIDPIKVCDMYHIKTFPSAASRHINIFAWKREDDLTTIKLSESAIVKELNRRLPFEV